MLVVMRLEIPAGEVVDVPTAAGEALSVMAREPGYLTGSLGRAVDDPARWVLSTRWSGAGPCRRGLSSYDVKVALAPLMAFTLPQESVYDVVASVEAGPGPGGARRAATVDGSPADNQPDGGHRGHGQAGKRS